MYHSAQVRINPVRGTITTSKSNGAVRCREAGDRSALERGQKRHRVPECDLTAEDYVTEIPVERPQVTENQHLRNIIGCATYYRQHQRLADRGIVVSRSSLKATRAEPPQQVIYDALGIDAQPGGIRKNIV